MSCGECGTPVLKAFYKRLRIRENNMSFFQLHSCNGVSDFIQACQLRSHLNCESAIIPVAAICDGLPKYVELNSGPTFID